MADEAFALSPISANGVQPSQADYDAISEAFMETARGRWFLNEYAKRNRNADTSMVLEAVARIERSLAAQKLPLPAGAPDILAAVSALVATARASADAAMAGPMIDEVLVAPQKSALVIREIAWRLRESGADGRICGLLDAQADVIKAACENPMNGSVRDGVLQAFDIALKEISDLASGDIAPAQAEASVQAAPAPKVAPEPQATPVPDIAVAVQPIEPEPVQILTPSEPIIANIPALVPQPIEQLPVSTSVSGHVSASLGEASVGNVSLGTVSLGTVSIENTSLGATLIASGVVAKPAAPRSDPLAAIRRMSSAEKIAFFS